jgi:hypothetical protein
MNTKRLTKILEQINKSVDNLQYSNTFVQKLEFNIIQNYLVEFNKELLERQNEEN